jgi:hypothetical protein
MLMFEVLIFVPMVGKKVTVDQKVTIEMYSRLSGGWESTYMSG